MADKPAGKSTKREQEDGTKLGRLMREYDLTGLGEEIERRWVGGESERQSLRDLADDFNRRVLEAELKGADEQPIDGEIQNLYRLLAGDEVSASARTQAETRLNRLGIDIESLRRDFVSHQAVHTYLTNVRKASLPEDDPSADEAIESKHETVMRLRNRLVAVTERSLESLRDAGHLSIGSVDIMVSVTVYCNECGGSYELADLLRRRACDCTE